MNHRFGYHHMLSVAVVRLLLHQDPGTVVDSHMERTPNQIPDSRNQELRKLGSETGGVSYGCFWFGDGGRHYRIIYTPAVCKVPGNRLAEHKNLSYQVLNLFGSSGPSTG
jgi:hypothetical protein